MVLTPLNTTAAICAPPLPEATLGRMIQLAKCLAFSLVCGAPLTAIVVRAPQPTAATQSAKKPTYPTFEPFLASRMFDAFFEDVPGLDLEAALTDIEAVGESIAAAKNAAGGERRSPDPKAPRALLQPVLDNKTRCIYTILPVIMMKLQPLWESSSWTTEQFATARTAAGIVARIPGAPKLEFLPDKAPANRKQLEDLVNWFQGQTTKPECYAAMIPTMDDGPFQGLPHDAKSALEAQQTSALDAKQKLEVRLCKTDRPREPWVLQGVRGGKLLWSRIVSGAPDESVSEVALRGEPKPLGTYGWVVPMSVEWSQGAEQAYLYVDAKGGSLFYFLSW